MKRTYLLMPLILIFSVISIKLMAQNHSVARQWNDVLLAAIRGDLARPTVHARNLFQISAAMYDAWAIYDDQAATYLTGNSVNGFGCELNNFLPFSNVPLADQRKQAISYAAFRMLLHRFEFAPDRVEIRAMAEAKMQELGYDISITSTNYSTGSPAALGNYIAQCYINYGLQDGANEEFDYVNFYYEPVNDPLAPTSSGNALITDFNRWQPLALSVFIDQSGNVVSDGARDFLGAEWGNVMPFSLTNGDKSNFERDGDAYHVYRDPGSPPYIEDESSVQGQENDYRWNFELVSIWGSHLDPSDGVMWDISPASGGNIESLPTNLAEYRAFYNEREGGDPGQGHSVNPVTNLPYAPNIVPRGDYTRVLAEFWADGPASETPPGHWFTILNYVNDHPLLVKKFKGQGEILDDLEWDIKAYFLLGGAMHDAAITAWGIKGWYDYIRPISAIRAMASKGQSSDPNLPSYNAEQGITLKEGLIELVEAGDPLAGSSNEHVGKIKLYTWRGPDYIQNPEIDEAGVGWILADNWWPYQRPTFVTPPFAGYISGHSTFSRTAAVILAELTGSEFFPGGVGEFIAPKNEFLVFEEGPSVDVTLQWATYRDASDQTSLSRIWGGIHPPADDIPGRIIGEQLAPKVFEFAESYFQGIVTGIDDDDIPELSFGPNPVVNGEDFSIKLPERTYAIQLSFSSIDGSSILNSTIKASQNEVSLATAKLKGVFLVNLRGNNWKKVIKVVVR
ncbi:MAG: hypothetical protein COW03_16915 [Cytophagales bacterium CG12_big_fil_rev_8_21_14_0_65_40_12]|nr:MAG: hypothetical protein COW03_16915 [Cytophagales bacterium CG12_big_fil_rev_8_21_14_0_65_40_12]PIW05667.1 MAG: hypothetical protein COW40_03265 [Cytophagales bacterium CG17_big_fil_post_rev_8_21_14_2_50_40_13]